MPSTPAPWGHVCVGTRLEKNVEAGFVHAWTNLLLRGLRKGDAVLIESGKVAHWASNELVRRFLKTECDTLMFLDSDADDLGPEFLSHFRDYEGGWEFDALQAFYTRRGWPPEPIWFKEQNGVMMQCMVLNEGTEEVALIGTHCVLIRREVFEKMLGDNDPAKFDWFYYPRHEITSEDGAFSAEARRAGFRLGATTHVKVGHISHVTTGWDTYQDYMKVSGQGARTLEFIELAKLIAEFTGETPEAVMGKAMDGPKNVQAGWRNAKPASATQTREFYGAKDNGYLYDLLAWNTTPLYQRITEPLKAISGQRVLVIGAGIGGEVTQLVGRNWVFVFELPGVLREFCEWRFSGEPHLSFLENLRLTQKDLDAGYLAQYDWVVAVDVIEHIHPDELEHVLETIAQSLAPAGRLCVHNNFGQQDKYPMHFDHSAAWAAWLERQHLVRESEFVFARGD